MTKSNQDSGVKTPLQKQKMDAITEKANKLAAGFNAESEDDNTRTKAEVVKMTPRARMEFFKNGGKFENA